jgi:hypothetical protein
VFGCVSSDHNSNYYRKKLDVNVHSFIMMEYSEESKDYGMFDLVK